MGKVLEINGPLVTADMPDAANGEQMILGALALTGETVGRDGERAIIQVYEATDGLRPGDEVIALRRPLSVELGPGLLGGLFDGVQRPLGRLVESGARIQRGETQPALDRERSWCFEPRADLQPGDRLEGGQILGHVQETAALCHRILVPPPLGGELLELAARGDYRIEDTIARLRDEGGAEHELKLLQRWPVRQPRPYRRRDHAVSPLITGQRVLDCFFPLLKGGRAAIPGPFGAGKTVLEQQIARWADADIVIYVGCGERGNEVVEMLDSFPQLTDPYSGHPIMERTVLVANTSNMPVVAREACIHMGVTIAEYFRDQGLDVVLLADSTSRWAEALREVSGRLGQMPVEEGYPAYLASRLAAFYERAGKVQALCGEAGSVTLIGSVSPPGGDFSEPVTEHTKDFVPVFWALSKELSDARHYPAISWVESFSGNVQEAGQWWAQEVDERWAEHRRRALALLAEAEELERIVGLVGPEALSASQRWSLACAVLIKEAMLQQNALDDKDSFASPQKQFVLLDLMLAIYTRGNALLEREIPVESLLSLDILNQARRWKVQFGSEEVDELRGQAEAVEQAFDELSRSQESEEESEEQGR